MNNIILNNFSIDDKIIAKEIYSGSKREITQEGVILGDEITGELNNFLTKYSNFIELEGKKVFFRIDCYFDDTNLFILDINTSFVDGWGNALNFTRAIKHNIDEIFLGIFPDKFLLLEEVYRPEFELCLKELSIYTNNNFSEIIEIPDNQEVYIYGNSNKVRENIFPYNGVESDSKFNLARFSKIWKGENVKIPNFILPNEASYNQLDPNVVLKVANKKDIRPDGRNKIIIGKGRNYDKMWEEGKMVAQEKIEPHKNSKGENMQVIIMAIGNFDLGVNGLLGYVQSSTREIINDNSKQSPLILKD